MIPIYRAKTIKQDYNEWEECEQLKKINGAWYAIGFYDSRREIKRYLGDWETINLILIRKSTATSEVSTAESIDPTTLSIHFPDMLDSQGNKIFASLQKDGKGGDIVENYSFNDDYKSQISIYDDCKLCLVDKDGDTYCLSEIEYDGIKVIGIQQ